MIEIGGRPILWHIMSLFSAFGVNDFVVCLGYKGYLIKEYFANYHLHASDVTFDLAANTVDIHRTATEPWRVTLVDTGIRTMTGGRLKRAIPYVGSEPFYLTYGDGLSDVDLAGVYAFHRRHGLLATVTAVQSPGRFGSLQLRGDRVTSFTEKPMGEGGWINGGFFVLSPEVDRYIDGDDTVWEEGPLQQLAEQSQLASYKHLGFWHAMDTLRDKESLQRLWDAGRPPWIR